MDAYKAWVRQNRELISSLESLATTATWFLPERFVDSQLTPEAVSTLLGLVTVMNQHIIETDPPPSGLSGVGPQQRLEPDADHDDSSPWSLCISVMREVEVLTELAAEYFLGKEKKWGPVASVEAIKLLIRLIIFKKNGCKMLLDGGQTKNVGDAAPTEDPNAGPSGRQHQSLGSRPLQSSPGTLPRVESSNPGFYRRDLQSRAMQAMQKFNRSRAGPTPPSWLARRPQQGPLQEEFRPRELSSYGPRTGPPERNKEIPITSRAFICGEILLISRPLLYVLLLWRHGLRSWRPWVAALSIDLAGMFLVSSSAYVPQRSLGSSTGVASSSQRDARIPFSTNEQLELRKRKLRLAFYVLRNPFFDRFTRHQVEAAEKVLSPVPLLGMLAGKACDLLLGIQGLYSYTSAS